MERDLYNHREIVELLPDYALLALPEADERRVEFHLASCPACREGLAHALDVLGTLASVPPPRAHVRDAFLARVSGLSAAPDAPPAGASGRALPPVQGPTPVRGVPAPRAKGAWPAARVVAAALAAMLLLFVGWQAGINSRSDIDEQALILRLTTDPEAVYPLDITDLPEGGPTGVLYGAPDGTQAYLVARGLPPLPSDQRYQFWLIAPDEGNGGSSFVGIAQFEPSPDGEGRLLLHTPEPLGRYLAAAITAEPATGSAAPTAAAGPTSIEQTLGGFISG